jgi:hypothetical protein
MPAPLAMGETNLITAAAHLAFWNRHIRPRNPGPMHYGLVGPSASEVASATWISAFLMWMQMHGPIDCPGAVWLSSIFRKEKAR